MILSDMWAREVYGSKEERGKNTNLTFCGALEKCYVDIAYYWREKKTRKKNESSYENIILPALEDHDEKRIGDYTKEDYEEAIEVIKRKGYTEKGVIHSYSESSIKNFERLIYYVVFQAAVRGYCENVLWGTKFEIDDMNVEDRAAEKVQLKKSLSPNQEKKMAKELLSDITRTGEEVGVLLMLALGTRNGEACGLNYGDIKTLQQFSEDVVAWIYKSTIPDSSTLQSSGKTWNTGRIVPVPQKVARYLEERKQRLERHLEEIGELGKACIEDLPIVCKGNMLEGKNYEQRASARAISNAAKEIFKFIEVEGRQLAYIEAELLEDSYGETVNEKDPTAYLLRRNYATHLQLLGLSVSEIQYLIGHNVEDIYESRNEFVDEKRIHEMAKKLSYRPLLNELKKDTDILEVTLKKGEEARIIIEAQEPLDKLEITVIGCGKNKACTGRYFTESYEKKYDRVIDVTQAYHKAYH